MDDDWQGGQTVSEVACDRYPSGRLDSTSYRTGNLAQLSAMCVQCGESSRIRMGPVSTTSPVNPGGWHPSKTSGAAYSPQCVKCLRWLRIGITPSFASSALRPMLSTRTFDSKSKSLIAASWSTGCVAFSATIIYGTKSVTLPSVNSSRRMRELFDYVYRTLKYTCRELIKWANHKSYRTIRPNSSSYTAINRVFDTFEVLFGTAWTPELGWFGVPWQTANKDNIEQQLNQMSFSTVFPSPPDIQDAFDCVKTHKDIDALPEALMLCSMANIIEARRMTCSEVKDVRKVQLWLSLPRAAKEEFRNRSRATGMSRLFALCNPDFRLHRRCRAGPAERRASRR